MQPADAPAWLDALAFGAQERPKVAVAVGTRDWGPASAAVIESARLRLRRHGPAVSGRGGNTHTFEAGAIVFRDYALDEEEGMPLLLEWNQSCLPPWDEDELLTIVTNGARYAGGIHGSERAKAEAWEMSQALMSGLPDTPPAPPVEDFPAPPPVTQLHGDYAIAAKYLFLARRHASGLPTIRKWKGSWYEWGDPPGCYREMTEDQVEADIATRLECEDASAAYKLMRALKSVPGVLVDQHPQRPCWLSGDPRSAMDPRDFMLVRGEMVHLPTGEISPSTPAYFCTATLGVGYDPTAPAPARWLRFLEEVLPNDSQARDTIQEWFGYCLVPDVRQQKILYLFGPIRCGKGTIMDVLSELVGPDNAASPTLSMLATNFGMAPLIDKLVAMIPDARLDARSDTAQIAEKLLMVSGADKVTLDRKYLNHWRGRLTARFMISSNELIPFRDASSALASRLIMIELPVSFYGREDPDLGDAVRAELPGVLLWAIEGWRRLRKRGYFVMPASSEDAVRQMEEASNPIKLWVREMCTVDPDAYELCEDAFGAHRQWCSKTNHPEPSSTAFGRQLRAACSAVRRIQTRKNGKQVWIYRGIRMKKVGEE